MHAPPPFPPAGFASLVEVGQLLQVGRYLATGAEGASVVMEVMEHNETEVVCRALNAATLDGLLTVRIVHTEVGQVWVWGG